jgi:hypothetical protein
MGENPLPNSLVLPGQRLCELADTYKCGVGTYEHQGFIHSSLAGPFVGSFVCQSSCLCVDPFVGPLIRPVLVNSEIRGTMLKNNITNY